MFEKYGNNRSIGSGYSNNRLLWNLPFRFSVFGLFAVIVSWLMASLYLATSVALGDLCVSPDGYLTRAVPATLASEVLSYYTHCENTRNNPFSQRLNDGQIAANNMRDNMSTVTRLALELFKEQQLQPKLTSLSIDVNTVNKLMSGLTTLLDCKPLHKQYVHAAKSLCHLGLWVWHYFLFFCYLTRGTRNWYNYIRTCIINSQNNTKRECTIQTIDHVVSLVFYVNCLPAAKWLIAEG